MHDDPRHRPRRRDFLDPPQPNLNMATPMTVTVLVEMLFRPSPLRFGLDGFIENLRAIITGFKNAIAS
jgi:hypothetical protein